MKRIKKIQDKGFALVSTLSIMLLLMILALAMLSLSNVEQRTSQTGKAMAQAQANARLALMIAIGELQQEMGPDMRISAEAAIHDTDAATPEIEGIAQPHWLAVYDSWGSWLNAEYTPEGKDSTDVNVISDTYVAKRSPMFRRWLVSLPENLQTNIDAPVTGLALDDTSVIMVGEGTLGKVYTDANPNKITRAYKNRVGDSGNHAWWISPENHKAKINLAAQQRTLTADEWATAQGVTSEVAIGKIDGFEKLDITNTDATTLANRMISFKTLGLDSVGIGDEIAKQKFFDLTEVSSGVLSSTKTGGLKKDLSLLFEMDDSEIPEDYRQTAKLHPEPSIRPHSEDILAQNADLPRRPFASWPNMRHYYRMYREDTDSSFPNSGHFKGSRELQVSTTGAAPHTDILIPDNLREDGSLRWYGENAYHRFPIIARYLIIHSYKTERYYEDRTNHEEIAFYNYDTPLITLWNPYNTPLRVNSNEIGINTSSNAVWPQRCTVRTFQGKPFRGADLNAVAPLSTENGDPIIFQPGEFKVFSFRKGALFEHRHSTSVFSTGNFKMFDSFDPSGVGGLSTKTANTWRRISENGEIDEENKEFDIQLDYAFKNNMREGNTPGSLSIKFGYGNLAGGSDWKDDGMPQHYQIDWFQKSQQYQSLIRDSLGGLGEIQEVSSPLPVSYTMLTLKGINQLDQSASWAEDWRTRNWLHSPPFYYGSGLYMTEDSETRAHTQRLDSPYVVSFGPTSTSELIKLTGEINGKPYLGFGSNAYEKVTAVPSLELPTAPLSSLASFSGMRMSPGWIWNKDLNPDWTDIRQYVGSNTQDVGVSMYNGAAKQFAYQSGITGAGIGNSFIHPMIARDQIYRRHQNSVSHEQNNLNIGSSDDAGALITTPYDTKAYSDYWDHVLVLNDALWDNYFISSIADQTRPWASTSSNLTENINSLSTNDSLPISRYKYEAGNISPTDLEPKLTASDGYLKAAEHLMVDGAFNINSTSVNAWHAIFKGIRERKLFYRDNTGDLKEVTVPANSIALSRFDTPTSDQEVTDPSSGVSRADGNMAWTGVRFLDDDQLRLLAEKCVEQVKKRGPFLNFSEFINRRLENNELGLMGALQSAIDFDDENPDPKSINYIYKQSPALRISPSDLGKKHEFLTPEAVTGSRLAGIPGYITQSDLLKPIANTLTVRDDTFRIRAYGETLDNQGNVIAKAWCEAIVQRSPSYLDSTNEAHEPLYKYEGDPVDATYDPGWDGKLIRNDDLTSTNQRFGRKFLMVSFRWLANNEI